MAIRIALVGNPNSGKTTLFNVLTASTQYVGNRPGVTVEKKAATLRNHKDVTIVDLPGVYSLSPYTMEETVARDYLLKERPDAIINPVDATNIERNLYLTHQLFEMQIPVIVALNMIDLAEKKGDSIDLTKLKQRLGCEVILTSASKGRGISELAATAVSLAKRGHATHKPCRFSADIEAAIFKSEFLLTDCIPPSQRRWYALKLLERDFAVLKQLQLAPHRQEKLHTLRTTLEQTYGEEITTILITQRHAFAAKIVQGCVHSAPQGYRSNRMDAIFTHRYFALPLFLLILWMVYGLSIRGIGRLGADLLEDFLEQSIRDTAVLLKSLGTAEWLVQLITDGILRGVGMVLTFLPQLTMLFLCLAILEDCGYMTRIAFIMDRIFRKCGLSGKSVIPLLVASGCGVPGIMSCRTIESDADRKITVMVATLIPCGAKLPIIALIAGTLFEHSPWVSVSVYLIGIGMVFLSGLLLKKCKVFASQPAPFVLELPPYRLPNPKTVVKHITNELRAFLTKAGTIIFLASGSIWILSNVSWNLHLADTADSILASLGNLLAPVYRPLGLGQWQAVVATLTGFAAKENLVSSLTVLYELGEANSLQNIFTPLSGYAFLLFNMLCSPCVAAIGAMYRELKSRRLMAFALLYQTGLAYMVTLLFYQIGSRI